MALDDYRQRRDEEAAAKAPEAPEVPTLSETLHDARDNKDFGDFLALELPGKAGVDLAAKLARPEDVKPGDMKELSKIHTKFIEKIRLSEKLEEAINEDTIVEFAKGNTFLTEQLKLMKPEQLAKVFKEQMRSIAIKDDKRFKSINKAFNVLQKYKEGAYKTLDEEIKQKCKDFRMDEKKFVEIMSNPNRDDRIELFRQEFKESFGFWDFMKTGWFARERAEDFEYNHGFKDTMDEAMKKLDKNIKSIGGVLGKAVEENDEMREAFMKEVIGDTRPKKPELAFREVRSSIDIESATQEEWAQEKESAAYKALGSDADKKAHLAQWKADRETQAKKETAEKGGFWSKVCLALLQSFFKKTKFEI